MKNTILIVDDEKNLLDALKESLELEGFNVKTADSAKGALNLLFKEKFAFVISDITMPDMSGYELLRSIKKKWQDLPVLLMTAYGSVSQAVNAIHEGACDYITKPFDPDMLIEKINKYMLLGNIEVKDVIKNDELPIIKDSKLKKIYELAKRVSNQNVTVLIGGESGTGKEVLAQYIHKNSQRCDKPFIAINCAAIPENMLESTLFGFEKGAFTGAFNSTMGKFESANDGTLLLDEISEMPINLQAKLLRVIQEKEVERLGGKKIIPLNVRLIATTNKDLKKEVVLGKFREDLFYRLNVFPLNLPPLRERVCEIIPLAIYFINRFFSENSLLGKNNETKIGDKAKKVLETYQWPGNIRELQNVISRALILSHEEEILPEHLSIENESGYKEKLLNDKMLHHEYVVILNVLKDTNGNRNLASDKLGISSRTLRYKMAKMKELGLDIP